MKMKIKDAKLVQFKSTDNILLPGLLFEPAKKTKKVAVNLHGNGSSSVFYGFDRTVLMGEELNKKGISFITFNNRGAHYLHKLRIDNNGEKEETKIGTALEIIKDCIKDIDGSLIFLKKLGYEEFYLVGHSTGANKICVYNYYKSTNNFSKYILAGGGDDTGILMDWMGGPKKLKKYLAKAKMEIEKGRGEKLIPKYFVNYMLSYQSFYDMCNPDGDYNTFPFNEYINKLKLSKKPMFREYKSIKKPTLVIYGEKDEYCYGDVPRIIDILKKESPDLKLFEFEIVKDADHGFSGKEKELAVSISSWLSK